VITTNPEADRGDPAGPDTDKAVFVFDVDGTTYDYPHPTIAGAEIMTIAGITLGDGLIQILPDGTRVTVEPTDTVHLVPGAQFKRRPRFKRG
jgi:hypothetical protein